MNCIRPLLDLARVGRYELERMAARGTIYGSIEICPVIDGKIKKSDNKNERFFNL